MGCQQCHACAVKGLAALLSPKATTALPHVPRHTGKQQCTPAVPCRLSRRSVQVAHAEPSAPSMLQRSTAWVQAHTGFTPSHLKLGLQVS